MWQRRTGHLSQWPASWGHHSGRKQEFSTRAQGRLGFSDRKRPGVRRWRAEGAGSRPGLGRPRSLGALGRELALCRVLSSTERWIQTGPEPRHSVLRAIVFWISPILSSSYDPNVWAPLDCGNKCKSHFIHEATRPT